MPSATGTDGDGGHSKKGYAKPGTSLAMIACVADAAHDDDYIKTGKGMTLHDIVKYCGDKVGVVWYAFVIRIWRLYIFFF